MSFVFKILLLGMIAWGWGISPPERGDFFWKEAEEAIEQECWERAITPLTHLVQRFPGSLWGGPAHFWLGKAYWFLGKPGEGEPFLAWVHRRGRTFLDEALFLENEWFLGRVWLAQKKYSDVLLFVRTLQKNERRRSSGGFAPFENRFFLLEAEALLALKRFQEAEFLIESLSEGEKKELPHYSEEGEWRRLKMLWQLERCEKIEKLTSEFEAQRHHQRLRQGRCLLDIAPLLKAGLEKQQPLEEALNHWWKVLLKFPPQPFPNRSDFAF